MLARDLMGVRVYRAPAKDKAVDKDGAPREPKRLGRVHFPVFIPDGTRVVGFMVKLPDVAGMIRQKDRFVALDALTVYEGTFAVTDVRENFDAPAAKRLGIDLDRCLIWTGMDVLTESGEKIGWCVDASFNGKTGAVDHFVLTASSASSALVGNLEMPVAYLRGYRNGAMVVSDETKGLQFTGGAAAKAAEVTVVATEKVKKGAAVLDDKGSKALDKGSRALGRQLGKTKGMFKSFASEYRKAAGTAKSASARKKK